MGRRFEIATIDATPEPASRAISPYIVVAPDGEAVLIDSGPASSVDTVLGELEARGLRLEAVILTHIHLDHGGAAGRIARSLGVKVYVHPRGAPHLVNPERLWRASKQFLGSIADYYGKPEPVPEGMVVPLGDGETVNVGGIEFKVVHTPGHASHHMSILLVGEGILFTGDSAGVRLAASQGGVVEVPTNPPPFKPRLYMESLVKMAALRPRRVALGHYGLQDTDGLEYLKHHAESIIDWFKAALEAYKDVNGDLEAFKRKMVVLLDQAAKAATGDPIIEGFFLYGALAGLVDAIARGEELPLEPPPLPP